MRAVTWVVKASKFCNLRCTYCYEWDELAQRKRISPEQWRRVLMAARRYGELASERSGEPVQSRIVWHGGEPLLLPLAYIESVVDLEREVFGKQAIESGAVRNFIQTNLTTLPNDKLELLAQAGFELWFSFDWIHGVRLDRRGKESEAIVAQNLRRALERGLRPFGVTVLAGHTRDYLCEIHDQYATLGLDFRVLPLFDAPNVSADFPFNISEAEVVNSLCDLFVHWYERGRRIRVVPLEDYLATALLHVAGLERPRHVRRESGEHVFVVNTDGTLYAHGERYVQGGALGNLFRQEIGDIVGSRAYAASLDRNDALLARHCAHCRYSGACDGDPVQTHPHRWPAGPCPIASRVCSFIEDYIRAEGFAESAFDEVNPLRAPARPEIVAAIDL